MFERFTDRSRKVMALANQEAQRFNHEYIGTEHILLGLVKEGSGVGANVLKNLDVDLKKVRQEVEKLVKSGPDLVNLGKPPLTPRAKMVIEYAIQEARALNHDYVGTEHLLLGLLREHEGAAAHVLLNLNLKLDDVRNEVLKLVGATPDLAPPIEAPAMPIPAQPITPPPQNVPLPRSPAEGWITFAIGAILLFALPNTVKYLLSFAHLAEAPQIYLQDGQSISYVHSVFFLPDLGITVFCVALMVDGLFTMLTRRRGWLMFVAAFMSLAVLLNVIAIVQAWHPIGFQILPALAAAFGIYRLIELTGRLRVARSA